jgi:hypothetical protein
MVEVLSLLLTLALTAPSKKLCTLGPMTMHQKQAIKKQRLIQLTLINLILLISWLTKLINPTNSPSSVAANDTLWPLSLHLYTTTMPSLRKLPVLKHLQNLHVMDLKMG